MEEELKWIKRIQKRHSRKEADQLVRKYYDEIYVYVYRQTGNKEDSLDLTQEIFISVLRSIKSYREDKAAFRTWLYRIATNKITDQRRKQRPQFLDIENIEVPDEMDYLKHSENQRLLAEIDARVSQEDAVQERIFRLQLYQGWTFSEIGRALEMPEGTVKTKYHRLCQKIRKEFHDEYYNAK
ncbi:MAG: RNA polymerase sigma factor [Firmicutes bacterium]|nr:RNA polymerase sigma factor [Bacillota bacterium]